MQPRPERHNRDVWFIYSHRPGEISAAPANAKGWVALAGCFAVTVLVGLAASRWALAFHPVFGFFALFGVVVIGVLVTIGLAMAKGRKVN